MVASGFKSMMGLMTSNVGELGKSLGGKAGLAGAVVAAGLAGWEFGTKLREWFPQIDVFMQKLLDGVVGFFDNMWKKFVHTTFYKTIFGDEAAATYDKADAAEAAYQKALKMDQQKKMLGPQAPTNINITPKQGSSVTPVTPKAVPVAVPVSPVGAKTEGDSPKGDDKPVNLAKKPPAKTAGPAGTTLIAGDVYLDGNLVGRHLLRGAGSN
jgi:hypothetical protein